VSRKRTVSLVIVFTCRFSLGRGTGPSAVTRETAARLWLVRHARPLVAAGVCYGRLDVAADPGATLQTAEALARDLPQGVRVHCSPLQRCTALARALQALRPDTLHGIEPRITELDFGAWEGQPWSRIARSEIDAWANRLGTDAPGGGETLAAMLARVDAARQQALAQGGDAVWLTHAGVARCMQWLRLQHPHGTRRMPQAHEWPKEAPACGTWVLVPLQG